MLPTSDLALFLALLIFLGTAGALYLIVENRPYRIRDEEWDITPNIVWRRRP